MTPSLGPPFITVTGLANFRDIGPLPISSQSGHSIRTGLIYRSAEPSRVTDDGVSKLQDLKITHVYDLRSAVEIQRHNSPIREWPGCKRVFVPIFHDQDYSPEAIALRYQHYSGHGTEGFVEAYRTILDAGGVPFGAILAHLATPDPAPLLIHCTAGKDRTGVICAVILSLCGVDDETIAQEYSLTEAGLAGIKEEIVGHLLKNPALEGNPEGAERMISARQVPRPFEIMVANIRDRPENMLAAMEMLRSKYGSAEKYALNRCGLSQTQITQIRKNLITESSPSSELGCKKNRQCVE